MNNFRTKVVCTLGPACHDVDTLKRMIAAGMRVARLNFSHGSHDEHAVQLANVRAASREEGVHVAVMADLQGPKIRVGELSSPSIALNRDDEVTITTVPMTGDRHEFSTDYPDFAKDVKPGDRVLIDDGTIHLVALGSDDVSVRLRVVVGGILKPRKGINLPGVAISTASITEKDRRDLVFAREQGVDLVAVSFVRHPRDIMEVRRLLEGSTIKVVAKIERPEALDRIAVILNAADGVMVARGDLGVEIPLERVPVWQKRILSRAVAMGRFSITATQMLDSMIEAPMPTRAEVSDVANAILDGTDAVMLSAETAVGAYPVEAVATMGRVAAEIESIDNPVSAADLEQAIRHRDTEQSVAVSAALMSVMAQARCIVAFTESGYTALLISRQRPAVPIIGFTPHAHVARQMAVYRGVVPRVLDPSGSTDRLFKLVKEELLKRGDVVTGDRVVVTLGLPFGEAGTTNLVHVLEID